MARQSAQQDLKREVREEVQLGTQPARPRGLVQHGVRTDGLVQILHILDTHRLMVNQLHDRVHDQPRPPRGERGVILHERIQDLAAAERELLHLRARHPEGGVILWPPMLDASGHRLVHRRELVPVTKMLHPARPCTP